MLQPASDCFAGVGYRIRPRPLRIDDSGSRWGSFAAERGHERLRVDERIYGEAGSSWADVSAWYRAAASGQSTGPWWAITIAESEAGS